MPVSPLTVLVLDDADVSALLCLVLVDAGIQAFAASDASKAVALYRAHHSEICLILLDSELANPQLLAELRAINPRMRYCLLAAGNPRPELSGEAIFVFAKPFSMDVFVAEVRRLASRAILD